MHYIFIYYVYYINIHMYETKNGLFGHLLKTCLCWTVSVVFIFLPFFWSKKAVPFSHLVESGATQFCFLNFMVHMKEKVQLLYFQRLINILRDAVHFPLAFLNVSVTQISDDGKETNFLNVKASQSKTEQRHRRDRL